MSLPDRKIQAAIAVNRFGLGAKGAELAAAESDPRGWLNAQLGDAPLLAPPVLRLPTTGNLYAEYRRCAVAGKSMMTGSDARPAGPDALPPPGVFARDVYLKELEARTRAAVESRAPLAERLVWFWSNHFSVSWAGQPLVLPLAGAFEREAIRPHVLGSFEDMLAASSSNTAMLFYLDNAGSIGPNSPVGKHARRGFNENLGREILELHTLGVNGGYTQQDVTTFAKALTGWSVDEKRDGTPGEGAFRFVPDYHEPGPKTILGKTYPDTGQDQARAVLHDIARHPATARHVATKLTRHFIADNPPQTAVDSLADVFLSSGGDLRAVTRALIASDEAWQDGPGKIKTPTELMVSMLRGLSLPPDGGGKIDSTLGSLGQRPFAAPAPTGWPDTADDWAGPYAVYTRIEWATRVAAQAAPNIEEPETLARAMLGARASAMLLDAVGRAESRPQALALLLASPDFQRR